MLECPDNLVDSFTVHHASLAKLETQLTPGTCIGRVVWSYSACSPPQSPWWLHTYSGDFAVPLTHAIPLQGGASSLFRRFNPQRGQELVKV